MRERRALALSPSAAAATASSAATVEMAVAAWLLGVAGSPIRPAEPNTALFLLFRTEDFFQSSRSLFNFPPFPGTKLFMRQSLAL